MKEVLRVKLDKLEVKPRELDPSELKGIVGGEHDPNYIHVDEEVGPAPGPSP